MKESAVNKEFSGIGGDLSSLMAQGMLVVADLSDPLLSPEEANGIFEVLLDQFRSDLVGGSTEGGKLLVLDEAHRYVSGGESDGLSRSIVDAVRLMRHEGLRVAISTQSPKVLAPELVSMPQGAGTRASRARLLHARTPFSQRGVVCIPQVQSAAPSWWIRNDPQAGDGAGACFCRQPATHAGVGAHKHVSSGVSASAIHAGSRSVCNQLRLSPYEAAYVYV